MARIGITSNQIETAIKYLKENGWPITIQNIRNTIGSGSFSTISAYLRRRKEEKKGNKESRDYYRGYNDAIREMQSFIRKMKK